MPRIAGSMLIGSHVINPNGQRETHTVTLAQINAGHIIVAGHGTVKWVVDDLLIIPNGTFTTLTDVRLATDEATPTEIAIIDVVSLVDDKPLDPVTIDAQAGGSVPGMGVVLAAGAGIKVRKTGSTGAGGTDLLFIISYRMDSGLYAVNVA